jgi:hypothetical protein
VTDRRGRSGRLVGEAGGASLVVLASIVVIMQVASVAAGTVGRAVVDRTRAQIVADAVALAGVHDVDLAGRVAAVNGGRIDEFDRRGGRHDRTVDVTVSVGRAHAAARATLAP